MISILKNEKFLLGLILVVLLILRITGLHISYYQDEYKWPLLMNPEITPPGSIPHPPLSEFIYSWTAKTVGYENFRYTPFLFSILNLFLIFYLVRKRFNTKAALWSSVLFAISGFSVIASLMVDTDGQILPSFFLISIICFYNWQDAVSVKNKILWGAGLLLAIVSGFLVKLSFIIAIGAIIIDFLYSKSQLLDRRSLLKYFSWIIIFLVSLVLILISSSWLFSYFNLSKSFSYWSHFAVFKDRNYLQSFIQFFKALLYVSPLLLLPLLLVNRETAKKLRIFWLFIVLGLVFYLGLFDFSTGALDRYFQFLIVPLCIISGVIISNILTSDEFGLNKKLIVFGGVGALLLFGLQFLPHFIPPLHPKEEWISRILSLKWNFLFPFFGGSGPLGFYVSWLFTALSWLVVLILAIFILIRRNLAKSLVIVILMIGISYNLVFIEEYLLGKINGSTQYLLTRAVNFIEKNDDIKMVTTFNDIGGYELMAINKYRKRLYIDPKFDVNGKVDTLNRYKEHYLVINIPRIDSNSIYQKYFDSCAKTYEKIDREISSIVYDCRGIPDLTR